MEKFLIIDGNSIMNRAFYGVNSRMTSKTAGIHTNAIYGFLNIYWMIVDKVNPDYIAVSFDLKAPTFRHKMYSEYKGTRKGMPDELREQMPVIKEVLGALNIPIIEKEGFEADDILGTVSNINTQKGIFTYILTGDKDSFQLISDTTSVIIPLAKAGKTEYTIYTPELLKEKQNIEPYQVVHIKSLMGDASDNIPGVKGIGEKTAYGLIEKYATLDNIYENIDNNTIDTTPKIKEKLIQDREMAKLSFVLATIDINVPIEIEYKKCAISDANKDSLYELFKKLEFSKFMTKFDFSDVEKNYNSNHIESKSKEEFDLPKVVTINDDNLSSYESELKKILLEDRLSYIINNDKEKIKPEHIPTTTNVFAIYSYKEDTTYVIDNSILASSFFEDYLLEFIKSDSIKCGFDFKVDMRYFFLKYGENVTLNNFKYDLMIASYLLDATISKYNVESILSDLYSIEFAYSDDKKQEKQISLFDTETDQTKPNVLTDLDIENICKYLKGIYLSYDLITEKLKSEEMLDLFYKIEMPLVETLAAMEHAGMYVDREKLKEFDKEITASLALAEQEIYQIAGESFNINSTQQLGKILFEKLGLEHKRKTKSGYSTDKSVLESLIGKHEIIEKILNYRQLAKLKSTYVDGLQTKIDDDSRIHTTFMQTVTTTGRLSSIEPNLQNIPIKIELGRKIRSFFVGQNSNIIVDADYSQIELRVMSHISNDEVMINAFNNNVDIHTVTASQVFNVPIEEVTKEMRSKAKAVNFGIIYGISAFGLSKNISCSRNEAAQYISNYLSKYHGIRNFMDSIVAETIEKGYVTTMFGRRRYVPEITDKNKNIVEFGKRIAMNTPIQGTAADIIKLAMNKVYTTLKERKLKSKLIMQVHDELIVEATEDELEIVKEILTDSMKDVVKLSVPLDIDLNVGKTWYDAK